MAVAGAEPEAEAEEVTAADLGRGLAARPGVVRQDSGGRHTVSREKADAAVGVVGGARFREEHPPLLA